MFWWYSYRNIITHRQFQGPRESGFETWPKFNVNNKFRTRDAAQIWPLVGGFMLVSYIGNFRLLSGVFFCRPLKIYFNLWKGCFPSAELLSDGIKRHQLIDLPLKIRCLHRQRRRLYGVSLFDWSLVS